MQVIVDGLQTTYERTGSGPVVVLLHGWGDSLGTFKQLTQELAAHYTVIAIDLPGFGATDTPKVAFNLEKYAQFVADFVSKLDIATVYAYVGHSNGGAIAIKGLSSGALRSKRLVLLASSGIRRSSTLRRTVLRSGAKLLKLPVSLLPDSMQQRVKKRLYKSVGSDYFVAPGMSDTFKQTVAEDVGEQARTIRVPTLLLYGDNDPATPLAYGQIFNEAIQSSKLVEVPQAGHFLHHTHAEPVQREIITFLGHAS